MSAVSTLISWNFPSTGARVYAGTRALPMRAMSDTAHAYVLHLGELQGPVLRTFAADTAFLDTAEWRHLRGDETGVQADDAVLQRLGDAPGAGQVPGVKIGGEAEFS